MKYDYIIIGAGSAGLSFAALMEKRGFKVCILESHSIPGGCSSYFERDGFIFDAGATTLSGFQEMRPLKQLYQELNLKLELKKIDPGIISLIKNKKIHRYSNAEMWIAELEKHFPNINHRGLWKKLSEIEKRGWILTSNFKNLPLRSFRSLFSFLNVKMPLALKTSPEIFRSVESELAKYKISHEDYLSMIDEMLFITAQNNRHNSPLLMGAMGLCYPEDTWYAMGGMKAFAEAIAERCSNIFYRQEVQKITKLESGFIVHTSRAEFEAKHVVSTIPIWNHAKLFDAPEAKKFFSQEKFMAPEECWSAFMIYLTIPLDAKREGLYYQIHTSPIPHCHTKSYFVSLSHPEDKVRSHSNRQVVTISTHTRASDWLSLSKDEYLARQEEVKLFILNSLKEEFQLNETHLQNIMTGTPKTFVKYTKRYQGLVGGIPHSLKRNPLDYIIARSPYENFYMLGDTQFPGQGIAAVILGSMNLVNHLTK